VNSINFDLIMKRLSEIKETVDLLKKLFSKSFSELIFTEIFAIRYLIIQLVESAASICMHIMTNIFGKYPNGYPQCFLMLAKENIIPKHLAEKLASAARLRNLLIHRYWEIDDLRVYTEAKKGIKDFISFYEIIKGWLSKWKSNIST